MYTSINLPTYCIQSFRHTMLIFTHAVLEKCDWSHTRSLAPNAFASSHSVSLLLTTTATFISLTHSPHSYSFDALYLLHSSPSTLKSLTVYSSWCWSFTLHSFLVYGLRFTFTDVFIALFMVMVVMAVYGVIAFSEVPTDDVSSKEARNRGFSNLFSGLFSSFIYLTSGENFPGLFWNSVRCPDNGKGYDDPTLLDPAQTKELPVAYNANCIKVRAKAGEGVLSVLSTMRKISCCTSRFPLYGAYLLTP